jgi:hypothetical protein
MAENDLQVGSAAAGGPDVRALLEGSSQQSILESAIHAFGISLRGTTSIASAANAASAAANRACSAAGNPILTRDLVEELVGVANNQAQAGSRGSAQDAAALREVTDFAASGPSTPASVTSSSASGTTPSNSTFELTGRSSGRRYVVHRLASDQTTHCSDHAYGPAMVAFLTSHPCFDGVEGAGAHRFLGTITVGSRTAALSVITVDSLCKTEPCALDTQFVKLESASGTGGIDDMLRDGNHAPQLGVTIPVHEAFLVAPLPHGTTILDAWWLHGSTTDLDPALVAMEHDLLGTRLTPFQTDPVNQTTGQPCPGAAVLQRATAVTGETISGVRAIECEANWATAQYDVGTNQSNIFEAGGIYRLTKGKWTEIDRHHGCSFIPTGIFESGCVGG